MCYETKCNINTIDPYAIYKSYEGNMKHGLNSLIFS